MWWRNVPCLLCFGNWLILQPCLGGVTVTNISTVCMCTCMCICAFLCVLFLSESSSKTEREHNMEYKTCKIFAFFPKLGLLCIGTRQWSTVFYMIRKVYTQKKRIISEHNFPCYRFSDILPESLLITSSHFVLFKENISKGLKFVHDFCLAF
jgi:hypothetical protein